MHETMNILVSQQTDFSEGRDKVIPISGIPAPSTMLSDDRGPINVKMHTLKGMERIYPTG